MDKIILMFIILTVFLFISKLILLFIRKKFNERFLNKTLIFCFSVVIILFTLTAVVPYLMNMRDYAAINADKLNIQLYNKYIDEYSEAARKQIAQYKKMEEEMARISNSTQLQYWSKQVDEVSNALTNRIKEFKDDILNLELDINKLQARIEARYNNKLYIIKRQKCKLL